MKNKDSKLSVHFCACSYFYVEYSMYIDVTVDQIIARKQFLQENKQKSRYKVEQRVTLFTRLRLASGIVQSHAS